MILFNLYTEFLIKVICFNLQFTTRSFISLCILSHEFIEHGLQQLTFLLVLIHYMMLCFSQQSRLVLQLASLFFFLIISLHLFQEAFFFFKKLFPGVLSRFNPHQLSLQESGPYLVYSDALDMLDKIYLPVLTQQPCKAFLF